jgi:hypothetical protein
MAASDTPNLPSEPTRSCAAQGRICAGIGDVVTVIEALGIDPKQYFDTVPGALGYPRRRARLPEAARSATRGGAPRA